MIEKIIVWNIRGLGTSKRRIRKLVRKYEIFVLVVSEPFRELSKLQRLVYSSLISVPM